MLKRIKVVRSGKNVRVMGFSPASRGAEQLLGFVIIPLADVKAQRYTADMKSKIGLDLAPKKRVSTDTNDIP